MKTVFLYLLLATLAFAESPDERFRNATSAMNSGDYGESAYQLRELVAERQFSHGSLHNLGNAEWKVVRPGHAILAWERAQLANPHDKNTAANLAFARHTAELPIPTLAWHESYSALLAPNVWLLAASAGFWGGVFLLTLPRLLGTRRADWRQGVAALLFAAFLFTIPALFGLNRRGSLGVALGDDPALRLTPTREGEKLVELPAGTLARVEKTRGNFFYVRAEGDRAGWIHRDGFERIWSPN